MARPYRRLARTALAIALASWVGVAAAGQVVPADYLTVAAVIGEMPLVQGRQVKLAVELRIADGYHVNANPPSEDWLIPAEIRVESVGGVSVAEVFYPEASEGRFGFYSGTLRVYAGSVVAGVLLDVTEGAAPDDYTLEVKVQYQACDDEVCFAPTDAETRVPVRVAEAGTPTRTVDLPLLRRARFEPEQR